MLTGGDEDGDQELDGEAEPATIGELAAELGLEEGAVEGAGMIIGLIELCQRQPGTLQELGGHGELVGKLAQVLDSPDVAELVQVFGIERPGPATEGVLRAIADAAPRRLQAPPLWLLAEQVGDARAAEVLDLQAAEAHPQFAPALLDAARAAEDRGDAATARQRLLQAGVDPNDPRLERVQRYARRRPAAGVGRNTRARAGRQDQPGAD